jgi:hypothetical protein
VPCLLPSDPIVKPLASAVRGEDGDCVAEAGEHVTELHLQHRVLAPGLVRGREDRALAHLCCGWRCLLLETKSAASQQRSPGDEGPRPGGACEGWGCRDGVLSKRGHNREASHFSVPSLSCKCAAPRRRRGMPYVSSSGVRFEMDGPSRQRRTTLLAYVVIASAVLLSLAALVRLGSAASAAVASVSGASAAATSHRAMPTRRVVTADDLVEASGGNSTIPT